MQNLAVQSTGLTQFELNTLIIRSGFFSKIKLKPTTRLVIQSLLSHYPNIRVKIETLQNEAGSSRKSIENSLSELKEKGLILIKHTGRSSQYYFTQKFFELLECADQVRKKNISDVQNLPYPHNKENNKKNNKSFKNNFPESSNLKYKNPYFNKPPESKIKRPYHHDTQTHGINIPKYEPPEKIEKVPLDEIIKNCSEMQKFLAKRRVC